MSVLDEVDQLLAKMSRAEKERVLQRIVQDLGDTFPGVETAIDVSGGEACIVGTRIPVWLLVQFRHLGMTEAELLTNYPTLRAEDLAHAWAYYRAHSDEIEQAIRANEEA